MICGENATTVDVPFSQDWQESLRAAMVDLGTGSVLVTDALGVEVDKGDRANSWLSHERFPLRCRATSQHPVLPSRLTSSRLSFSSVRSPPAQEATTLGTTQISLEIQFVEVWPGILKVKLDQQGVTSRDNSVDHLKFLAATDATGVELDLRTARARFPSPERFPLKLHFRTRHAGPQNVAFQQVDKITADIRNAAENKTASREQVEPVLIEHSMELKSSGILSDTVDAKLEDIGVFLGEESRLLVLVTDCLGVIIHPYEGVPDRHRFPIKVHIERSTMIIGEASEEETRKWYQFGDMSKRKPALMRGGSSLEQPASQRLSVACHDAWRSIKRAGSKEAPTRHA